MMNTTSPLYQQRLLLWHDAQQLASELPRPNAGYDSVILVGRARLHPKGKDLCDFEGVAILNRNGNPKYTDHAQIRGIAQICHAGRGVCPIPSNTQFTSPKSTQQNAPHMLLYHQMHQLQDYLPAINHGYDSLLVVGRARRTDDGGRGQMYIEGTAVMHRNGEIKRRTHGPIKARAQLKQDIPSGGLWPTAQQLYTGQRPIRSRSLGPEYEPRTALASDGQVPFVSRMRGPEHEPKTAVPGRPRPVSLARDVPGPEHEPRTAVPSDDYVSPGRRMLGPEHEPKIAVPSDGPVLLSRRPQSTSPRRQAREQRTTPKSQSRSPKSSERRPPRRPSQSRDKAPDYQQNPKTSTGWFPSFFQRQPPIDDQRTPEAAVTSPTTSQPKRLHERRNVPITPLKIDRPQSRSPRRNRYTPTPRRRPPTPFAQSTPDVPVSTEPYESVIDQYPLSDEITPPSRTRSSRPTSPRFVTPPTSPTTSLSRPTSSRGRSRGRPPTRYRKPSTRGGGAGQAREPAPSDTSRSPRPHSTSAPMTTGRGQGRRGSTPSRGRKPSSRSGGIRPDEPASAATARTPRQRSKSAPSSTGGRKARDRTPTRGRKPLSHSGSRRATRSPRRRSQRTPRIRDEQSKPRSRKPVSARRSYRGPTTRSRAKSTPRPARSTSRRGLPVGIKSRSRSPKRRRRQSTPRTIRQTPKSKSPKRRVAAVSGRQPSRSPRRRPPTTGARTPRGRSRQPTRRVSSDDLLSRPLSPGHWVHSERGPEHSEPDPLTPILVDLPALSESSTFGFVDAYDHAYFDGFIQFALERLLHDAVNETTPLRRGELHTENTRQAVAQNQHLSRLFADTED